MTRFEGFSEQEVSNDMIASFNTLHDIYKQLCTMSIGDFMDDRNTLSNRVEDVLSLIGKYVSASETIKLL